MEGLSQAVTVKQAANEGIVLPTQVLELNYKEGLFEVEVQANVTYNVSSSVAWITYTGTKGLSSKTLCFAIERNKTYDAREGEIIIQPTNSPASEQKIRVIQAPVGVLNLKDYYFEVSQSGGEIEANVETNIALDVWADVDWIHYVQTKALGNSFICLTVDQNQTPNIREGNVHIKERDGSLHDEILIMQAGNITIPDGAVDLGLMVRNADGSFYQLLWAECNLGATSPEEFGNYYSWGETEPKTDYGIQTYKWCNKNSDGPIKYCQTDKTYFWMGSGDPDGKTILDPEDDAAHVILGGKWRMPTEYELLSLRAKCIWVLSNQNGVDGYLVKSKVVGNDNSIFLPFAGMRYDLKTTEPDSGRYWSSSLGPDSPLVAGTLRINKDYVEVLDNGLRRTYGLSIRAVTE